MPDWLIERGFGETRCALVENGEIVEARVRRDGVTAAGTILDAKLIAVAPRLLVEAAGEKFLLPRATAGVTEGRTIRIEVTREALGGAESWKRGLARPTDESPRAAPELADGRKARIEGWDDLLEEARSGIVRFEGGELRIEPTAAMTMIDIDGWLMPDKLARMGAWAAARAIRRLDIGGPIGIDFPTLKDREQRKLIDQIMADHLPRPFEKTAMNGFGFLQAVRPRARASLIELAQDRAPFEARALIRRAGLEAPGAKQLAAHPALIAVLQSRPDWLEQLARQVGGAIGLRPDPSLPMSGGYAENA